MKHTHRIPRHLRRWLSPIVRPDCDDIATPKARQQIRVKLEHEIRYTIWDDSSVVRVDPWELTESRITNKFIFYIFILPIYTEILDFLLYIISYV